MKNPEVIVSACYQDGLLHALERIMSRKMTREYSCADRIIQLIKIYQDMMKERLRAKLYHDVAYIEGYISRLFYLLANEDERDSIPRYYLFGSKQSISTLNSTLKEYSQISKSASTLHKASYKFAKRVAEKSCSTGNTIFHHTPFLWPHYHKCLLRLGNFHLAGILVSNSVLRGAFEDSCLGLRCLWDVILQYILSGGEGERIPPVALELA